MSLKTGAVLVGLVIFALVLLGGPLNSCGPTSEVAPSVAPLTSVPTPSSSDSSSPTPSSTTPAAPVETLCGRLDQALVQQTLGARSVELDPGPTPAEVGLPSYDVCLLRLGGAIPLRVAVSVLPATTADLTTARKSHRGTPDRSILFLAQDRLVKLSGPPATPQKYAALARNATAQVPGLVVPPEITRPECDRATDAAAAVLGAPATARRDTPTLTCAWLTATAAVSSTIRTDPAALRAFETARKSPTAEPIPTGEHAFIDTRTKTVHIRTNNRIATLTPLPTGRADKNAMLSFTLKIAPLYTR